MREWDAAPSYAKRVSPSKVDAYAEKLCEWLKSEATRSPLASSEDVALVQALQTHGARIAWSVAPLRAALRLAVDALRIPALAK